MTAPLLELDTVSIAFGPIEAVHAVSLTLQAGEILGIAGESGSGKSTLCRAAMGLLPGSARVSGAVRLDGQDLLTQSPGQWCQVRGSRIGMIFQNPSSHLNPLRRIGPQIADPMIRHLGLSQAEAKAKAAQLLNDVGIRDPERRARSFPHELSGGMKQRVMIAAAISCQPRLLIADEPTTALDVTVQARILNLLKELNRARHLSMILISHDLGMLANVADRIMVMRNGVVVEEGRADRIVTGASADYTRLLINSQPGRRRFDTSAVRADANEGPVVEATGLEVSFPIKREVSDLLAGRAGTSLRALSGVDIGVRRGEIVGIVGESGSGKSTFAKVLNRQNQPSAGKVTVFGTDIATLAGAELTRYRRRVQMVFQNPYDSLNPRMRIIDAIAEPIWRHGLADRRGALEKAGALLDMVELPRELAHRRPRQLSGGQCQRVGIARALALDPDLLIADEITSALDVTTQAQILDLLVRIQKERALTLIYISHDLAVVGSLCQRVYVFQNGRIVESGPTAQVMKTPGEAYTRELLASMYAMPGE